MVEEDLTIFRWLWENQVPAETRHRSEDTRQVYF